MKVWYAMANKTPEDNPSTAVNDSNGGGAPETSEENVIAYEDISFTDQPGFKPMIVIGSLVIISFILLAGLPQYAEPGDGEFTLFTYTTVVWGLVIVVLGFAYEYWLMKIEGGGW
ncbi:hypothetical protein SAMN04487967_3606 [Natronorubrum sediminis]|uniref:Uncharacterized protein n=1 Tax=Natronorubrum sediminis TaxID=640943 RepID=A0A1H6G646_9EURY|nr:hypothetical protein SAMN04487967_3606 [Natronorubrum sediminis]